MQISNVKDALIEAHVATSQKSGFNRELLEIANKTLEKIGLEVDINGMVINTWDKPGEDPFFSANEAEITGN